jgi:F0F1-type ATP synthase assembly protein I
VKHPEDNAAKAMGQGYDLLAVGLTFGAAVALFTVLGVWGDRRLGTTPLLTLIGVFAGLGLGGFWVYQKVKRPG